MIEWISVKEKKPRIFKDVIVGRSEGNKSSMAGFYDGEKFMCVSIAGIHEYMECTHWCDLPLPPVTPT